MKNPTEPNIPLPSETIFQEVIEIFPDAVMIVDSGGRIVDTNTQFDNMFGYAKKELLNRSMDILIPENARNKHKAYTKQFFKNPQRRPMGSNMPLAGRCKNGEEISIEISLSPVKTENNALIIATVRDISEKVYLKELELKNKELEQYAHVISHDLQAPVNSIIGLIAMIDFQLKKGDYGIEEYLRQLNALALRMKTNTRGLLEYSKFGADVEREVLDCNQVIRDVLEDLKAAIEEKGALIEISELPKISGHTYQIHLLFQNLIGNALKFHKKNCIPSVKVSAVKKSGYWEFSVSDNGVGIEKANYSTIFDIFKRLNDPHDFEGTGIGLAHCKKIVDIHQGEIWVESIPGKGSTFYFTLPVKKD
ncbi:MAG: PAS domain S-box protein [Cyclobacteriaceae bacterium]|nr:PAS domain S-box protein [Cyclobacteriaceae bacterium]